MEPNADNELLLLFVEEAKENLFGLESDLIQIEADGAQANSDLVHKVFRAIHSIKGAAGCLSLTSESRTLSATKDLSHRLENLLVLIRDRVLLPSPGITNILLEGIDLLSRMVDCIGAEKEPEDEENLAGQLTRLDAVISAFGGDAPPKSVLELGGDRPQGQGLLSDDADTEQSILNQKAPKDQAAQAQNSIRVDTTRLSQLLNTIGEVVIVQTYMLQITNKFTGSAAKELRAVLAWLDRNTRSLQLQIMGIRKVPIGPALGIYRRIVRDLALSLGKMAELSLEGEGFEVDKTIIERLGDPLKHMIRNSVDHGLESPEERRRLGKSETGSITLKANVVGTNLILDVIDDGKGLDTDAILAKAQRLGLVGEGTMREDQILSLICHPGFSTAEVVTDVSGRGVGMDVVKRNIEELRGRLEIFSERGKGTTFRIRIPSTMATVIVNGLLVKVAENHFVLPLAQVEECLEFKESDRSQDRRDLFKLREEFVPFLRLRRLFRFPDADRWEQIVVVKAAEERVGLVVDQVLGEIQTVFKPLDSSLVKADFFSGSTIMGNSEIALILDVARAIKAAREEEAAHLSVL